jgi:hypothetical protein
VIDLSKLMIHIPATLSLGIISLLKSITSVHNIPATLSVGIISLLKSITDVYNIPATLSLGIIILLWTLVIDLSKLMIPTLRVAGIF